MSLHGLTRVFSMGMPQRRAFRRGLSFVDLQSVTHPTTNARIYARHCRLPA